MITLFPRTKFVDEYIFELGFQDAIYKQIDVVYSEIEEVKEALSRHDDRHTIEEVIDSIHALQQIVHAMPDGPRLYQTISEEVIEKNRKRGYYE